MDRNVGKREVLGLFGALIFVAALILFAIRATDDAGELWRKLRAMNQAELLIVVVGMAGLTVMTLAFWPDILKNARLIHLPWTLRRDQITTSTGRAGELADDDAQATKLEAALAALDGTGFTHFDRDTRTIYLRVYKQISQPQFTIPVAFATSTFGQSKNAARRFVEVMRGAGLLQRAENPYKPDTGELYGWSPHHMYVVEWAEPGDIAGKYLVKQKTDAVEASFAMLRDAKVTIGTQERSMVDVTHELRDAFRNGIEHDARLDTMRAGLEAPELTQEQADQIAGHLRQSKTARSGRHVLVSPMDTFHWLMLNRVEKEGALGFWKSYGGNAPNADSE